MTKKHPTDPVSELFQRGTESTRLALAVDNKPKRTQDSRMDDMPTRSEIDAKLEAAEARTETRFVILQGDIDRRFTDMRVEMDTRFSGVERRIDRLVGVMEEWATEMRETRKSVESESKATRVTIQAENRNTRWTTVTSVIGAVLAVVGIVYSVHSLSVATQANMIAIFQAGQSVPKSTP